jgi:hypothetical protein
MNYTNERSREMKGYIIKVTYLTGRHKGHVYYMRKGGYITSADGYKFESDVYTTLGIAKSVCTKLYKSNELNHRVKLKDMEYRAAKGKENRDWMIYERESYEPYEVDYSKDIV